jgi:hypothetical protein
MKIITSDFLHVTSFVLEPKDFLRMRALPDVETRVSPELAALIQEGKKTWRNPDVALNVTPPAQLTP